MAGVRRRTKYRKNTVKSVEDEFPVPGENEMIVRVTASRGDNIFEIEIPEGESELALLPTKFRKLVWIRRGMFLIVSCSTGNFITASGRDGRVRFMIEHILLAEQENFLRKSKHWPAKFSATSESEREDAAATSSASKTAARTEEEEDDDDMAGVFKNTNRAGAYDSDLSESSEASDDDE